MSRISFLGFIKISRILTIAKNQIFEIFQCSTGSIIGDSFLLNFVQLIKEKVYDIIPADTATLIIVRLLLKLLT